MKRIFFVIIALTVLSCKDNDTSGTVAPEKPGVTSVTPASGRIGSYITLSGNGFDDKTVVRFGSQDAQIISQTASSIIVAVPPITSTTVDLHVIISSTSDILAQQNFAISQDSWDSKGDLPGAQNRSGGVWFAIGSKIYYGLGADYSMGSSDVKLLFDFWEYSTATNQWTAKKNFPGTSTIGQDAALVLNDKAYIITGNAMWKYDPVNDVWSKVESTFPPNPPSSYVSYRSNGAAFVIGNKGYYGTGVEDNLFKSNQLDKDFWEFDPSTEKWTRKKDFPGTARIFALGFVLGNKGYLGSGSSTTNENADFYEYDPTSDSWTKKTDCPASQVNDYRTGFSINNFGIAGDYYGYYYKYDPTNSVWVSLQRLPSVNGGWGSSYGLSAGNKVYVKYGRQLLELKID